MSKQVRVWGLRTLSRLWLLAGSLSILSLLLLGRCGIQETNTSTGVYPVEVIEGTPGEGYATLLEQREEENRAEVARLAGEIRSLKLRILQLTQAQEHSSSTDWNASECSMHVKKQIEKAELTHGLYLNNEYEMISFNHFTLNRVYPIDLGLGKRVVEKPIGFRRKDLYQALQSAVDSLNKNLTKNKYTLDDFVEGIYRTEPTTGTEYELYFRNKLAKSGFTRVTVLRPFAPLMPISTASVTSKKELIHIILPLSGRVQTFQGFMEKFVKIGLKNDRRVLLTVVYFGEEGLAEARLIMSKSAGRNSAFLRLLALNETFSRSKGLKVGAERPWEEPGVLGEDVLLFFCDVDIVFSARFLERCRWNASPGRSVYYPVVFSLYNPMVVYTLQGRKIPSETEQLLISRDTGFWRDFGYGMTCQYKSDLQRVRGFSEDTVGWGGEDVALYRKYVRSSIKVIRATDPGIFHIWHHKVCEGTGRPDQYRACIRSRALNEASHAQLGFLAFPTNSSQHRTYHQP
ncbi:chondroitin sulfate N-acetylgalactosaminyltransferase 2 [Cimex lectularius]|uniref:Hexosyltransferase n=1 Tax=Cimex lectularius TaxID=79782 RepID=A0A8I6SGD9_CIMLE|nr:chondroitin sulfate N-acetylgalactosaminyltransferase 2 [Cimex lectularius]